MSFTLVSYQRTKHAKKKKKKTPTEEYVAVNSVSLSTAIDMLRLQLVEIKDEMSSTEIYSYTKQCIEQSLEKLDKSQIEEIVCYGLGNFTECRTALFQLGLLLALKQEFMCETLLYDPRFKKMDEDLLLSQACKIISFNETGKRKVDKTTLFFLPHCPNKLFNNVISANWGLGLSNCLIIGNSVSDIISTQLNRELKKNLPYMYFISPHLLEIEIPNTFKYSDVFNDMSLHVFPTEKLLAADEQLWKQTFQETEDDTHELISRLSITKDEV